MRCEWTFLFEARGFRFESDVRYAVRIDEAIQLKTLRPRTIDAFVRVVPEATGQLAAELQQAATAGVTRMVDVGTDEQRSRLAIEHANASHESDAPAQVWATAGLHPHDSEQGWKWLEPLLQDAEHTRIVGVGECGLDYHYDHSPRDEQRTAFAAQIRLAHQYGLALVIHTRAAWLDTFAILGAEGVPARTVFHCFTGGPHEAERALTCSV